MSKAGLLILCLWPLLSLVTAATADMAMVDIGEGTPYTSYLLPINTGSNYSYSQQIFLQSSIHTLGRIEKLRFRYNSGGTNNSLAWTVYMGHTTKTVFDNSTDWVPTSGLTQVFSGSVTYPTNQGWVEITLTTPFNYNNSNNLVIAVDENSAGLTSPSATWEFVQGISGYSRSLYYTTDGDNPNPATPPAGYLSAGYNRIQLDLNIGVGNPTNFSAQAISSSQINLTWTPNVSDNKVLLAYSTSPTFGTPTPGQTYSSGNPILGGGTVISNGTNTSFNHSSLTQYTQYYYKAWSVHGTGSTITYSPGVTANSTTWAATVTTLPLTQSFDVATPFPPDGWNNFKVAGNSDGLWNRATSGGNGIYPHSGAGMAKFDCYNYAAGTRGILVSPPLNLPNDEQSVKFWMYRDAMFINDDYLNVYLNNTNSLSGATLLGTIRRIYSYPPAVPAQGWYQYTFEFPAGSTGTRFVIFEGVSAYGYNILIDDVSIGAHLAEILLSDSSYDFGLTAFDNTWGGGAPHRVTITNIGTDTITITVANRPQLTGTDTSQFYLLDENSYPINLNTGQSAYFTVRFTPNQTLPAGEKTAALTFSDNLGRCNFYVLSSVADPQDEVPKGQTLGLRITDPAIAPEIGLAPLLTRAERNIALRGYSVRGGLQENFDTHTSFTVNNFGNWTLYDGDGYTVAGAGTYNYANKEYVGAYQIFTPGATQPPITEGGWQPLSGSSFAACFANKDVQNVSEANNDWLITPLLAFDGDFGRFSFFARSASTSLTREKIKLRYSTTGSATADFTSYLAGSATTSVTVPFAWTLYEYEVPAAVKYIAIQCVYDVATVSPSFQALQVDDFIAGDYGGDPTTPVELSSFTASISVDNYINLLWITQSETNVVGYYVLRNTVNDLSSASVVSPLIPAVNSSQMQSYLFKDTDLYDEGTYYYWLQNADMDGTSGFHGAITQVYTIPHGGEQVIPLVTELKSVYPNPFNPICYIPFELEAKNEVSFRVYDSRGQLVRVLDLGQRMPGRYRIQWDGRDDRGDECANGVYYIRMNAGESSFLKKAALIK